MQTVTLSPEKQIEQERFAKNKFKKFLEPYLEKSGIQINGNQPWDLIINNEDTFRRVVTKGSIGLGESYMEGWWDCESLDEFFTKIFRGNYNLQLKGNLTLALDIIVSKLINRQSLKRTFQVAHKHYNLDNNLFQLMLDKRLTYSCGYWKNANTLDQAQENKLQLICDKIQLEPGMKILDIGSGWGSFVQYASEKYDVSCVGITISEEQAKYSMKNCKDLDVEIRLQDYRDLDEKFDRIVSVGMFEHVGPRNYKSYMKIVERSLVDDGIFFLQTIGGNVGKNSTDPWINKYIFPNGVLPSMSQITKAIEGLLIIEDLHNLSADYDKTLMSWYSNFTENWDKIKSKYDDQFKRMWTYYLLSCAGSFRSRTNQLWQIIFSKNGIPGGYKPRY